MISNTVRYIDENPLPEMALLIVNFIMGCLALVVIFLNLWESAESYFWVSVIEIKYIEYIVIGLLLLSFPLTVSVVFSSLIAMIWRDYVRTALWLQAQILGLGGAYLTVWGTVVLVKGTPEDTFSWFFGLMTIYLTYSVYLLRRAVLADFVPRVFVVRYLHMFALAVALCLDICMFLKAYDVLHLAA